MTGAFAVTSEIARMYETETRKSINIATNPINITLNMNPKSFSPNRIPRAVFLGSAKFDWNGIHLLDSLKKAYPEIDITIVGMGAEPTSYEQIKEVDPDKLITFLQNFDFGISTLALNDVGLNEGAPLKVRSYLSAGLPIIARFSDSGIPAGSSYYFKLEFNELFEITNKSELRDFLILNKGRRVSPCEFPQLLIRNVEAKRLRQILLALNPEVNFSS
jgi:hypothetical protein